MAALEDNAVTKVASVTGIDAKTVANTELYVVPSGKVFIPLMVVVRCTTLTGAKGVQGVASFGGNAANYDDFLGNTTFTFSASGKWIFEQNAEGAELDKQAAGDSFRINITTGSDAATAETWSVDLFGYSFAVADE